MSLVFRILTMCFALVIAGVFAGDTCAESATVMGKAGKQESQKIVEPSESKDVDAFVAGLSDVQARKLLQEKLKVQTSQTKQENSESQVGGLLLKLFVDWESLLRAGLGKQATFLEKAKKDIAEGTIVGNLTGGGTASDLTWSLVLLASVCAGGFAASAGVGKLCGHLLQRTSPSLTIPNLGRIGTILSNIALRLLEVVLFFLTAFVLFILLIPASGPTRGMGVILVVTMTYALLVQAFARILLSPGHSAARPLLMKDQNARVLYVWLMVITVASSLLAMISVILKHVGQAQALGTLVYAQAGPLVGLILCAMILANRERVAEAIRGDSGGPSSEARLMVARYWHYPAMLYALVIGLFWSAQAISGEATILLLVLSLFLIPGCIGVDLWVGRLLSLASGEDREVIHLDEEPEAPRREGGAGGDKHSFRYYVPLIRKTLRVALVAFTAFAMLKTWGVEIPLGWLFARNVLSVLMVAIGALLLWEVFRIRIDRKLSEEGSLPGEEAEEGGGAGGSRSATLLMLLRKFVLCVIVVMGSLIALSSLGVDIGPLIAGAGVVGLAIGFGAQTLVKDIISGVFFLVDDAFRVGDYVEAGTAKGTVEQISLRSMKLRHPRGMVFTIPYGGLKILKNYSRDYIISKLDFRVRYDANIDLIRKIIKRINKELMSNEDISKGMLSDIKSMGIRRMEDSAMILRIKFKSIPGHEFLVEKELYKRIQEEFIKNGIEFAHRNVTVYLPPEIQNLVGSDRVENKEILRSVITGAAAEAVTQAEEEELEALDVKKQAKDE